jgi:general secretion pathway protein F/type IV pilus assembly protein PilC
VSLFSYEAIEKTGKKNRGIVEAKNLDEAKFQLLRKNFVLLKIHVMAAKKEEFFSLQEKVHFTKQLSELLTAGLTLYEALVALQEKYQEHKSHQLIVHLCSQIQEGSFLSRALGAFPKTFDVVYCSMVANAEKTGSLDATLAEIAKFLTKQMQMKKQIQSALIYPGILSGFCFLVLTALIFFILPSLWELFEGRSLHPLTQVIFSASQIACRYKVWITFGGIGIIFSIIMMIISVSWRQKIFSCFLYMPFFQKIYSKVVTARFCRSFSVLLSGGVSYVSALKLSSNTLHYPQLEKFMEGVVKRIEEGAVLSEELKKTLLLPPLVWRMISVAEESGSLDVMLKSISQIYEEDVERTLNQLNVILQPVLLLVLGVIIGLVVLAVLLPLTDVSSFLNGMII